MLLKGRGSRDEVLSNLNTLLYFTSHASRLVASRASVCGVGYFR